MAQIAAVHTRSTPPRFAPAQIELAMALPGTGDPVQPHETLPAGHAVGFQLGWDYAQHGLTPPVAHLWERSALRQGWQAGQASYGRRTLKARAHALLWLQLRTHAWVRGRSFETLMLTPNYLQQLDTDWCPIRRCRLGEDAASAPSIDRVRDDAGYAAGNLALLSHAANAAKGRLDWASASATAQSVAAGPFHEIAGLGATEWQRVAVLCSFVTELPHAQAALIPLLLLPPNRLRLFNPIQALQALVTRQLATPGWSQRLARLEALLPSETLRADFNRFVLALAPRVLRQQALVEAQDIRWALEDAWSDALVQKRWLRFALQLDGQQAEQLVQRAAAKQLSTLRVQQLGAAQATEGWALPNPGLRH